MDSYYGFQDIQRPTLVEDPGYETIFEKVKAKANGEKQTRDLGRRAVPASSVDAQ